MLPNQIRTPTPYLKTLLAGVLFGLGSCQGRVAPQAVSAHPEPTANASPDEASTALPADFDKNLPFFPGSVVEHVRRPKGSMREVLLDSDAPVDRLIDFYKEGLQKGGYEVTSALKIAARKTWSCDFHKNGQQASVMLYPDEKDKSRVTIDLIYEMPSPSNERPDQPEEQFDVVGPGEMAQQNPDSKEKRN